MPIDVSGEGRATAELFRLRRNSVVDTCGFLGFVSAFGIAGIYGFRQLYIDVAFETDMAMFRYIATMLVSGAVGGLLGMGCGQLIASAWERFDLRRNPRRYERG